MGDVALKDTLFEQLARVGKALGHGKRLELLDLLAQAERSVEVLAAAAGLNLTTASAHLQALKQAGLVVTRRAGTKVFYRLAGDDVIDLLLRARQVAAARLPDVAAARDAYLGDDDGIETIGRDELMRRALAGEVTVLDVRPQAEYMATHLPGAVHIPIGELVERMAELPAGTTVVAYCRGGFCVFAHDAVRLLRAHGRLAARLEGGVLEWRLAGLPVTAHPDYRH